MVVIMYKLKIVLALILFTVAFYASAGSPDGAVYLDGGENKSAVILAHGKGKHPTWLVVDPLRKGINEQLGYHTLSLQMPTGYSHWEDYAEGFPDAYKTLKEAIAFFKNEKGVERVFLIGHSMGARMSSAFVSANNNHGLAGLVVAGCRNNGDPPLSCDHNLQGVDIPVLDIWGGNNGKDSRSASERNGMVSDTYVQVEIAGANHKFEGYEDELVDAVASWLTNQK